MSRPVDPRLFRRAPASRRLVVILTVLQLLGGGLVVTQAVLLARVVVRVFGAHADAHAVLAQLALLAAAGIARAAAAGVQERITTRASVRIRAELRRGALEAIVRLGPAWARRQSPGRLVNATGPGLDAVDGYVTRALPAHVSASVIPVLALGAIMLTDWQSGLILLILLPLVPLFMALIGITTNRLVERQYAALGRLAGQFLDLLRGLTTLRVYGQAHAQERTLRRATEAYRRQTVATLRIAFLSGLVLDLIAALSVAVVAVDIGLRLAGAHVSFATALLVLLLAPEVFAPLRAVGAQHHAAQEGATAAAVVLDIIDEAPAEVADGDVSAPASVPVRSTGRVTFENVSVTYPDRGEPAVADVSITFEPGRIAALTGPSGAGKSTLLAGLLAFVAPSEGQVVVGTGDDDVALDSIDADRWRAVVAWLPQLPRPSQATIADEVGLGHPGASDLEVAAVCRTCHTPEPGTALGEDGHAVSAGQRRRIALARALLRARAVRRDGSVPIVLLDEPSEDLDLATEGVVASVIASMAGWATVVVATHSPVLAALADVRVQVEDGRVVQLVPQEPVRDVREPTRTAIDSKRTPAPTPVSTPKPFGLSDLVREAGATRRLLAAAALSAFAAVTALGLTASSMWLISRAAQHPNVQALAIAVVGVRTFAIGRALLRYAERLVTHDGALLMLAALRVRTFAALRPLSPAVLGEYGRGDLLRRFVGDVDGAQEGLVRALVPSSGAAAGALGAVVLAFALSPAAGGALAVGLLIAGIAVPAAGYRFAGGAATLVLLAGQRDRASAGLLDALDEVVAYGGAGRAVNEIAAVDASLEREVRRPARVAGLSTFAGGATAAVTLAAVLAAGAQSVSSGNLSVVNVGVLAVCVLTGFDSVSALPAAFVAWARCRAGLQRVAEVISREPAFAEPDHPQPIPTGALGLHASMVDLAPAADAPLVLHDAQLTLRPGTRVAVVGPSGCGKSTLLTAALRMLPISRGSLALTGGGAALELSALGAQDVPTAVAGSLQGDHVFDSTLRDNLRVVRPAASDAELDAVAARVGLLEMVAALPGGWSTPAGPDGAALSGGQRQRLLVARALLADPHVLVLDEPTAHLDADTERLVLADLLDATSGRTVLMTTHRRLAPGEVDTTLRLSERSLVPDQAPARLQGCAVPVGG